MPKRILFLFCCTAACLFGERVTVIGIGRLGLCFALCLERAGFDVLGVDLSEDFISKLNEKSFSSLEPRVNEYLRASRNFRATTSLKEGLAFSDLYFIFVPTPSTPTPEAYDHTLVSGVLSQINAHRVEHKHVVIGSTVFPGYIREVGIPLLKDCSNTTLSYNPEFIAQGDIINGLRRPDLVLIGEGSAAAGEKIESIHKAICTNSPAIARVSIESAEIGKLAINCFITMKIAFANAIGDLADATPSADKWEILDAVGKDSRIGSKALLPGYGFGGPCFPRDNRALGNFAKLKGIDPVLFSATDRANKLHAEFMAEQLLALNLDEYLFEDVCYKPNCPAPIIEESQKLVVAKMVAERGKRVTILDKQEVVDEVDKIYGPLFIYRTNDRR